jgi:hypothetical protein
MSVAAAGVETRQSMLRVWMAISAVWVAFWLLIAAVVMVAAELHPPFADEFGSYAAIVLLPPLAFLMLGALARWTFEAASRAGGERSNR